MSTFTLKKGALDKIVKQLQDVPRLYYDDAERKMKAVVNLVYSTARAKRPKVGATKANRGQYRVSDPNAPYGVPVDTGALQASITKSTEWQGKKIIGTIEAGKGVPYATYIEMGTSRMLPRPFMRQALMLNKQAIINKFGEKMKK